MTVDKMTVDKMIVDKVTNGEMPVEVMTLYCIVVHEIMYSR